MNVRIFDCYRFSPSCEIMFSIYDYYRFDLLIYAVDFRRLYHYFFFHSVGNHNKKYKASQWLFMDDKTEYRKFNCIFNVKNNNNNKFH